MSAQSPPSGDPTEDRIKRDAGYVEFSSFSGPYPGYFCGTCSKYEADRSDPSYGFCRGLKVPVRSYGCCNYWELAPTRRLRAANGQRLRVVR